MKRNWSHCGIFVNKSGRKFLIGPSRFYDSLPLDNGHLIPASNWALPSSNSSSRLSHRDLNLSAICSGQWPFSVAPPLYSIMKTWLSGTGQRQSALPNDKRRWINPKHEIRNSKQYSMTKIQMFQTEVVFEVANTILFWTFGNLIFEFVSDFDIRISNFTKSPF